MSNCVIYLLTNVQSYLLRKGVKSFMFYFSIDVKLDNIIVVTNETHPQMLLACNLIPVIPEITNR